MSSDGSGYRGRVLKGKIGMWLAQRASRSGFLNGLCRSLLGKVMAIDPNKDFMRDEMIEFDVGFDPDELDRYQRGE